jgi:hypothetical protein
MEILDWIHLAQNRNQCLTLVNILKKLQGNKRHSLTRWVTANCSGSTLPHGVSYKFVEVFSIFQQALQLPCSRSISWSFHRTYTGRNCGFRTWILLDNSQTISDVQQQRVNINEIFQLRTHHLMCTRCGRRYKWRASLKSHLINEFGKEPQFQCQYCSLHCKAKSNLLRHLWTFHTGLPTCLDSQHWKFI